ncbi:alpha/beta fold hydrolase [Conexibacter sp. CPCC 206217]|uniref:alpha/beta fold hydrolase n=1 Tax=Conexibacter sp. CPCC 206217 TaxID=3064574 RepID=UPI002719CABB|nr:alpha/beta hydrolase [Conexibacter sp. CPCC 206217]MDO8212056.1 alpha/beta hydrolase [Conexibacter sp. CPCC 206217]
MTATSTVPTYPGFPAASWLEAGGLRTWWTEAGEGPPLVLVYGGNFGSPAFGGGNCAMCWDDTLQRLSASYRVITYDRPGNGYTDAPERDEDFTMEFVIDHLIAFLDAIDAGPVHLLGHSRGGFIATRTALLRQDLVKSLTIVTSGTLGPGVGMNAVALAGNPYSVFSLEGMKWGHAHYSYDPSHVTDAWMQPFVDRMEAEPYLTMMRRIEAERLIERFFIPQLARDKRETLRWLEEGRLQRPTQILWGLTDPTVPVQLGYDLYDILARHEMRVTLSVKDKSGHFPYREHPRWFDDMVTTFVEEVEADV